jgi:exosortase/archaeosortase family protein
MQEKNQKKFEKEKWQKNKEKNSSLLFGFKIDNSDAVKTGRFLVFFIITYLALSLIVSLIPIITIESGIANAELGIVSIFGLQGNVAVQETALINLGNGATIQISELCTGIQELLILVSAIIASIGIAWKKRIIGAVLGAVIAVLFNFFRITATILVIASTKDLGTIEFTHNILFRVFLFATIAVAYIAWFQWAIKTGK